MRNLTPASASPRGASVLVRVVGVWQMLGGAIAAMSWLLAVMRLSIGSWRGGLIIVGGIALAVLSFIAGYGLLRRNSTAILLSLCIQALQVVGLGKGNFIYQLAMGPYVDVTIFWWHRLSLLLGFQTRLSLRALPVTYAPDVVAINLFACACLLIVLRYGARESDASAVPTGGTPSTPPAAARTPASRGRSRTAEPTR